MDTAQKNVAVDSPRRRRRWPIVLLVLLVVVIALIAFAPAIVAGPGKGFVVGAINDTIKGKVAIDSLKLSWFGGQRIEGVRLDDPDGATVVTADSLSTDLSIWRAMRGNLDLGKVLVTGVYGDVKVAEDGTTNLQRAVEMVNPAPETDEPPSVPPTLAMDAELREAKVKVTPHNAAPAEFSELTARVRMPSVTQPITLSFAGKTKQGATSGAMSGEGELADLFDADGRVTAERVQGHIKADAKDVPAGGLDGLLALGGVFTEAMGGNVDAVVDASFTGGRQTAIVTITAPQMTATLKGAVAEKTFSITEPAKLEFTATPAFAAALAKRLGTSDGIALKGPTKITVTLDSLSAPAGAFDPKLVKAHAKVTATPIELTGVPQIGEASVRGFSLAVDTDNLAKAVTLKADAELRSGSDAGLIKADASVANLFDAAGKFDASGFTPAGELLVTNLPTALVDKLLPQSVRDQLKVTLVEALGPQIVELRVGTPDFKADTAATAAAEPTAAAPAKPIALDVVARSQRLTLIAPVLIGDRIGTRVPANGRYALPRSLAVAHGLVPADATAAGEGLRLEPDTIVELTGLSISAPRALLEGAAFDPAQTSVAGKLTVSTVTYTAADTSHFSIEQTSVTLIEGPLSAVKVNAHTTAVAANGHGTLARGLGYGADIDLDGVVSVKDSGVTGDDLHLRIAGKRTPLKIDLLAQLTETSLMLKRPGEINYELTPQMLADMRLWPQGVAPLAGPTPIALSIQKLHLPIKGFTVAAVELVANGSITAAAPGDLIGELFGAKLAFAISQTPAVSASQPGSVTLKLTSDRVNADAAGKLTHGEASSLTLDDPAKLIATITPRALALLGMVKEGQPTLAEPATITLTADDTTMPLAGFTLARVKSTLTAEIDKLVLAGDEKVAGAAVRDLRTVEPIVFNGPANTLAMKLTGSALAPGQTGAASPIVVRASMKNMLDANGDAAFAHAAIDADADVQKLPTAVVDALSGQGGKLEATIGPSVDVVASIKTTGGAASSGTAHITAKGEHLVATAPLKLADRRITNAAPITGVWTVTPAAYAAWTAAAPDAASPAVGKPTGLALTEPGKISFKIDALSYPLPADDQPTDWSKVAFNATIDSAALKLQDRATKKPVTVSDLNAKASSTNLAGGMTAMTTAKFAAAGIPQGGNLSMTAKLTELFDTAGEFNADGLSAEVDAKVKDIPGSLAEAVAGSGSGKVAALIGESGSVDARVKLQRMQGPVAIDVRSQNTTASIDGRVEGDYFYLNKDADASLMITEELAKLEVGSSVVDVLANVVFGSPVLKQAVKSIEPAKLHIAAAGFRVPVRGFDVNKVEIANATINPGKLLVQNAGLINTLVGLPETATKFKSGELGSLVKKMGSREVVEAWFTAMPVTMKDGLVRLDRMDMMLGDNYQIAMWGNLNLSGKPHKIGDVTLDPQHGRMILGLAERAMRRVYGINIYKKQPDYVDQFVMQGPIETLGPDRKELTLRIAALTGGGATGTGDAVAGVSKVVGDLLKATGRQEKFDAPPPAPVAPWPSEKSEESAAEPAPTDPAQPVAPTKPGAPAPTPTPPPTTPGAEPKPVEPAPRTAEEIEAEKERKREERRKQREAEKEAEKKSDTDKALEGIKGILGGDGKDKK